MLPCPAGSGHFLVATNRKPPSCGSTVGVGRLVSERPKCLADSGSGSYVFQQCGDNFPSPVPTRQTSPNRSGAYRTLFEDFQEVVAGIHGHNVNIAPEGRGNEQNLGKVAGPHPPLRFRTNDRRSAISCSSLLHHAELCHFRGIFRNLSLAYPGCACILERKSSGHAAARCQVLACASGACGDGRAKALVMN